MSPGCFAGFCSLRCLWQNSCQRSSHRSQRPVGPEGVYIPRTQTWRTAGWGWPCGWFQIVFGIDPNGSEEGCSTVVQGFTSLWGYDFWLEQMSLIESTGETSEFGCRLHISGLKDLRVAFTWSVLQRDGQTGMLKRMTNDIEIDTNEPRGQSGMTSLWIMSADKSPLVFFPTMQGCHSKSTCHRIGSESFRRSIGIHGQTLPPPIDLR